jgi:Tol biopolymer transport system component
MAQESNVYNYSKIKISEGIELVDGSKFGVESPAVSNDGTEVCFVGKKKDKDYVYPVSIYTKKIGSKVDATKVRKKILNVMSKCAYDSEGRLLVSELKYSPFAISASLIYSLRNNDFEPKRYRSVVSFYKKDDKSKYKKISQIKSVDLGQNHKREFIKHPRVSPNGEWITFYTTGSYGKKGIYLYHVESKKTIHLGERYEKHPTWTEDGTKVLFHYQVADRKQGGIEKAYLGYYDLSFSGDDVDYKRVMLDDTSAKGYVYHKHPAVYPGTDLLFFHGQDEVDGKKKIYVRRLEALSNIYELKMKKANISLKKAKHPTVSRVQSGIVFVGKENEKGSKYKVFKLNDSFIQSLLDKVL